MPSAWSLDLMLGPTEAEQGPQQPQDKKKHIGRERIGRIGLSTFAATQDRSRRHHSGARTEAHRQEQARRVRAGAASDSNDHGLVSLVLSLEARWRAVEATTCSVVLVSRETCSRYNITRETDKKYAQLVDARGRREHDLGNPHVNASLALLSTLAAYVPPSGGDQAHKERLASIKTLLEQVFEQQTQAELGEWVTTSRAEDCYDRRQQEKQGLLRFATKGMMEVSRRPSDMTKVIPHPSHKHLSTRPSRSWRSRWPCRECTWLFHARKEKAHGWISTAQKKEQMRWWHARRRKRGRWCFGANTLDDIDSRAIDTHVTWGTSFTSCPSAWWATSTLVTDRCAVQLLASLGAMRLAANGPDPLERAHADSSCNRLSWERQRTLSPALFHHGHCWPSRSIADELILKHRLRKKKKTSE